MIIPQIFPKLLQFKRLLGGCIHYKEKKNRLRQQIPDTDTIYSEMEVKLLLPFLSPLKKSLPPLPITIYQNKIKQELNFHISRRSENNENRNYYNL